MRISFARARASIRWFSDLSGAIDGFGEAVDGPVAVAEAFFRLAEGVVPVGIDIGGESTQSKGAFKRSSAKNPCTSTQA